VAVPIAPSAPHGVLAIFGGDQAVDAATRARLTHRDRWPPRRVTAPAGPPFESSDTVTSVLPSFSDVGQGKIEAAPLARGRFTFSGRATNAASHFRWIDRNDECTRLTRFPSISASLVGTACVLSARSAQPRQPQSGHGERIAMRPGGCCPASVVTARKVSRVNDTWQTTLFMNLWMTWG
jgi:hypothetical protein